MILPNTQDTTKIYGVLICCPTEMFPFRTSGNGRVCILRAPWKERVTNGNCRICYIPGKILLKISQETAPFRPVIVQEEINKEVTRCHNVIMCHNGKHSLGTSFGDSCIEVNERNRRFHPSNHHIFVILFLIDLCFLIIKEDILLYMLICFLSRFSNCFIVRLQPQVEI